MKDQDMITLADERLARLHKMFLDAAERFPELYFVVVTAATQSESPPDASHWPYVLCDEFRHLGLTGPLWLDVLNQPAGTPFTPIKTVWLWIGDRLWQGGFVNGRPLKIVGNANLRDDLETRYSHLKEALVELDRLADMAAGFLETPTPSPLGGGSPLEPKPAHRWLEAVAGIPSLVETQCGSYLVRSVPDDIFTASARRTETFGSTGVHPKGTAGSLNRRIRPKENGETIQRGVHAGFRFKTRAASIARFLHGIWLGIRGSQSSTEELVAEGELAADTGGTTCNDTFAAAGVEPPAATKTTRSTEPGNDHAAFRLLNVFTNGLADERLGRAGNVLNDDSLTVDEKLWKIDALMPIPPTASAAKLGKALGVSKAAVQGTTWYIQKRKGQRGHEIGRRREQHRERSQRYEHDKGESDNE